MKDFLPDQEITIIIFPRAFPVYVVRLTNKPFHLSLSSDTYSSVLSSFYVSSLLTCCSHLDLDFPSGRSPFTFMFKTFFMELPLHLFSKLDHTTLFHYLLTLQHGWLYKVHWAFNCSTCGLTYTIHAAVSPFSLFSR